MNTNPDEVKLALWLDDELHGEELVAFEQWVVGQPEHLAARDENRRWRQMISAAIPATEEPPYPDFFNSRLARALQETQPTPVVEKSSGFFWRAWLMPIAACAGMVAAFWMGNATRSSSPSVADSKPLDSSPLVYVPEKGVDAEWFSSSEASANVIVLQGVTAIPDSTDFFTTVHVPMPSDMDRTAVRDAEKTNELQQ